MSLIRYISSILMLLFLGTKIVSAQKERIEMLPFGDCEQWVVRYIDESALLGGKTKTIYVLGPRDTLRENKAYDFRRTPWGISNAYANIIGIAKAANTTSPIRRGDGTCAHLECRMETVKVLGMVNISVAIAGTLFLGSVLEPVRTPNNPFGSVSLGQPFTRKPKALMLDIKTQVSEDSTVTKALGWGVSTIKGHDEPEIYIYLQKRWEDNDGNIYAKRIGTGHHRFAKSIHNWQNDYRIEIKYGDISSRADFKPYMGFVHERGNLCDYNSKGKNVEIHEVGWGRADEEPTHIVMMISSGCHPAFIAHIGNAIWVDNIRWVFDE